MSRHGSLNRVYRVVFNQAKGAWQAVAEIGKSAGKVSSASRKTPGLVKTLSAITRQLTPKALIGSLFLVSTSALAANLPQNGQVVGGQAQIDSDGTDMTVIQSTDKAAINWDSFDIGQQNSVTFKQPSASSVALNRVTGSDPSKIQGVLNANGQVFLINPNGITFTQDAQVNVGGIVASTLDIDTDDFLNGDYTFKGDSSSAIVNQGNIQSQDGYVAMIAAQIENSGQIEANNGSVLMGAGQKVTLDMGGPVKIQVEEKALDAHIKNGGAIKADGGLVYLTAQAAGDLASTVINNDGIIEAQTLETGESGEIYLMGDMDNDRIRVGGTLDASAPNGGDGGFIETSAAKVDIQPGVQVTTQADNGQTGEWLIDPTDVQIVAGPMGDSLSGEDPATNGTSSKISNSTISSALHRTDVTIQTPDGGDGNGDIIVDGAIVWRANKLTLDADRNIVINAQLDASGGGEVFLKYAQTVYNPENENWVGNYIINAQNGYKDTIDSSRDYNGKISLAANSSFSTQSRNSYNKVVEWTIITSLGSAGDEVNDALTLQGLANTSRDIPHPEHDGHTVKLAKGNFVLANDIDASDTASWNNGEGFIPIGDKGGTMFQGKFDGLGHTISGLTINSSRRDGGIGLFGAVDAQYTPPEIRHTMLTNLSITPTVSSNTVSNIGGLVGFARDAKLDGNYVQGQIVLPGDIENSEKVGGLVGDIRDSTSYVYADLVPSGDSLVTRSNAQVNIEGGTSRIGGLVGVSRSPVTHSIASGHVNTVGMNVGGLVGDMQLNASVSHVAALGNVTGVSNSIGGLVGAAYNEGLAIDHAVATGNVTANAGADPEVDIWLGGLVGNLSGGRVANSYSTGSVTVNGSTVSPDINVGGLIGYYNDESLPEDGNVLTNVYSKSAVNINATNAVDPNIGALVGTMFENNATAENSYWDTDLTGLETAGDVDGAVGKTTEELQNADLYTAWSDEWQQDENINDGAPYLPLALAEVTEPEPAPKPEPTPEPTSESTSESTSELASEPQEAATREAQRTAAQLAQSTQTQPSTEMAAPQPTQVPEFNAADSSPARVGGLQVVNLRGGDQNDSAGNNSDSVNASQALADIGQVGPQRVFVVDGGIRLPDDDGVGE